LFYGSLRGYIRYLLKILSVDCNHTFDGAERSAIYRLFVSTVLYAVRLHLPLTSKSAVGYIFLTGCLVVTCYSPFIRRRRMIFWGPTRICFRKGRFLFTCSYNCVVHVACYFIHLLLPLMGFARLRAFILFSNLRYNTMPKGLRMCKMSESVINRTHKLGCFS